MPLIDTIFNQVVDTFIWALVGATFWLDSNGDLLVDGMGLPYYCDDCPCGGDPCANCNTGTTPAAVQFTLSGLTDGSCLSCNSTNTTYTLDQLPSSCSYRFTDNSPPCGCFFQMDYQLASGGFRNLFFFTNSASTCTWYRLAVPSNPYDCSSSAALNFVSDAFTQCNDWPATITVSPA